ncbi:MAG TPA: glycosyltransferase family 4 protein [Geminicoccus sp.]|uniref:glycosyltransferase family 4 protein n=1 Tax=Geminicoccus sp. TaxID=2024832 RepID=UPI002E312C12|nr:glycosyltransferase family 4 protein [Geminicoccus sp.]HEX2525780.1 glycosyltransferase family 4 protein [Geminicoccus sp.]
MKIAFYAPMKPPDHPVPSGDRRMGRSFVRVLERLGHDVHLACRLRSYDRKGDQIHQLRLAHTAAKLSQRLSDRLARGWVPDIWFTYHCYHKAPDLLGPTVSERLGIPYVVAEPSFARRRAEGAWAVGQAGSIRALSRADLLLPMTKVDARGLQAAGSRIKGVVQRLPPFLDTSPFRAAAARRFAHRTDIAAAYGLDPSSVWLLTVAMMRDDDAKRSSYLQLADALDRLTHWPWQLLIVGDGPAGTLVRSAFARFDKDRIRFLGTLPEERLPPVYAASDMFVWPALNEAYGMVFLEAQAAGLPVVAGRGIGVADVVLHRRTGLLATGGNAVAFANSVMTLLDEPERRAIMGQAGLRHVERVHSEAAAAHALDAALGLAAARRVRREETGER